MNKYVTPGVYVKEVDISTYYPPKKYRRIGKICRIYSTIYTPQLVKKK